jgi:hypothetical protein
MISPRSGAETKYRSGVRMRFTHVPQNVSTIRDRISIDRKVRTMTSDCGVTLRGNKQLKNAAPETRAPRRQITDNCASGSRFSLASYNQASLNCAER